MDKNLIFLKLITPYKTTDIEDVRSLIIKTDSGEIELLPFHCEYIANIEISILTITHRDNTIKHYAVGGGAIHFVEEENKAVLLLNSIIPVEEIDLIKAQKAQQDALNKLKNATSNDEHKKAQLHLQTAVNEIFAKSKYKD